MLRMNIQIQRWYKKISSGTVPTPFFQIKRPDMKSALKGSGTDHRGSVGLEQQFPTFLSSHALYEIFN